VLRERKHPLDLPGAIGVIANAAAHHQGAPLQAGHQVLVSTGHIRPAFLQEDARLEVDRPGIVPVQMLDHLKPEQPHIGVDLNLGSHMGDPVEKTRLEGRLGPRVHLVRRERLLHGSGPVWSKNSCGFTRGRCFKSVDPVSDCSPKLVPIDEEPNHQIVHLFRLGETDCATDQSLDPRP
jgi:hypothetical protein